jgi:tricorn protease
MPIALYDLKKNTYEELPKSSGMDLFPMWHGNAIYFISDRDGVMNLYSYDLGSKQSKKLTDYKEYDIKWPSLGPDSIVYENGGLLYEFNLQSAAARNIPIQVHAEDLEARPRILATSRCEATRMRVGASFSPTSEKRNSISSALPFENTLIRQFR